MIYILEGADGTGKTTLARKIQEVTSGHILHASYSKNWDIEKYHENLIKSTIKLNTYQDVILDRWAVSEWVYGSVFRSGESYKTDLMIEKYFSETMQKWIYCKNDNVVNNHKKNKTKRYEMFSDMKEVAIFYEDYVNYSRSNWLSINWIEYNFNKNNLNNFVEDLIND